MGPRFRLLTTVVVIGGVARLLGLALGDAPAADVEVALAMELVVTPVLCLWQSRVMTAAQADSKVIARL